MNGKAQNVFDRTTTAAVRPIALACVSLLFGACGGDNGVSLGDGQDSDPVVVDFPIAYIKSPLPVDEDGEFDQRDLREMISFDFGADLYYRDRASPSTEAVNITGDFTQGMYAMRDVEISYDGERIAFAMRGPVDLNIDLDDEGQPTWNIWEFDIPTQNLRRVIPSDLTSEIGHDVAPHYLPDGRVMFTSTRQVRSKAVLLDEGKPQYSAQDEDDNEPAFLLHVMNGDGSGIEQVSYNQSHDFDPSVLSNGQVVFSRWDNAPGNNQVNLYRMNPDGSELELLYGNESHDTGTNGETIQFMQPRELEDGRVMAMMRPFDGTDSGGNLIVIDTPTYLEINQPTAANPGMSGPAQTEATIVQVSTEPGEISRGGRFASVYPVQDGTGRLLVSWSQCRVLEQLIDDGDPLTDDTIARPCTDENTANLFVQPDPDNPVPVPAGEFTQAPPAYGIWMYDPRDSSQSVVVVPEDGFWFTEVVSADPRPAPPVILDSVNTFAMDPDLASESAGVLHIRSVYDFDGGAVAPIDALADPAVSTADLRPARFLRIVKPVSMPDEDTLDIDNTAFGVSQANGMREILGYVPIEPDGSVIVKLPANVAFAVSILDADGQRISARHQNWMQVRPGQFLECNGCHVANSGISHGRKDAFDPAWAGAQAAGVSYYPSTVDALFVGEVGETMAETRARVSCANSSCSSIEPSVNVQYQDVWTDEIKAGRAADAPFQYDYVGLDGLQTAPPTELACIPPTGVWSANCRITINYEENIHPLWSLVRPVVDAFGVPVLDQNGQPVTNTCTNCHNTVDLAGATQVPAGQLELTDGLSDLEPDHFHSYQELMSTDDALELDANGNLVTQTQVIGIDPVTGLPIIAPVTVGPSMSTGGANASNRFFSRFDAGVTHDGYLSDAEKRLVAEWLDVGAQYYNNPFDAPIN